jgi:hypothetical protein
MEMTFLDELILHSFISQVSYTSVITVGKSPKKNPKYDPMRIQYFCNVKHLNLISLSIHNLEKRGCIIFEIVV